MASIVPTIDQERVDLQKYAVIDPQRVPCTSHQIPTLPFIWQSFDPMIQQEVPRFRQRSIERSFDVQWKQFGENELIRLKYHLTAAPLRSEFSLALFNCLHQLAIDHKLAQPNIIELLHYLDQRLTHFEFQNIDAMKMVRDLQNASSETRRKETSSCNLSTLMKLLIRIDQLEKYKKLDSDKVQIFGARLYHL